MSVVKKKKRKAEIGEIFDPKAQRRLEREIDNYVMELDERAEKREAYIERILAVNDGEVHEIVDQIVASLRKMQGPPTLRYKGMTYNTIRGETELLEKIQRVNFKWIAIRLLVACAEWDIKIGSFKLPKNRCARCARKVA